MEKSDVYNMRAVPLMRKINIVKDGKTKSIVVILSIIILKIYLLVK